MVGKPTSKVRPGMNSDSIRFRPAGTAVAIRSANSGVSGSGNCSVMDARKYRPCRGTGQSAGTSPMRSGSAVIGRDWTIANSPPALAHSMSWGAPKCRAILAPSSASRIASASVRTAACPSAPVGVLSVRYAAGSIRTALSATTLLSTRPASASTTIVSVSTRPETTASPSPQAAVITVSSVRPFAGLAVNITPAESAGTSFCTTTARDVSPTSCWARYQIARSVHSEAQQSRTAATTSSAPTTLR